MGEIIPSESLSRVTYRAIDGMHSQKTKQPYIRSARKNRTTKHWVEEELSKFPIKKKRKKLGKKERKKKEETVKMSRLCKAGLFFLR